MDYQTGLVMYRKGSRSLRSAPMQDENRRPDPPGSGTMHVYRRHAQGINLIRCEHHPSTTLKVQSRHTPAPVYGVYERLSKADSRQTPSRGKLEWNLNHGRKYIVLALLVGGTHCLAFTVEVLYWPLPIAMR